VGGFAEGAEGISGGTVTGTLMCNNLVSLSGVVETHRLEAKHDRRILFQEFYCRHSVKKLIASHRNRKTIQCYSVYSVAKNRSVPFFFLHISISGCFL
jgi:hypothetical protein